MKENLNNNIDENAKKQNNISSEAKYSKVKKPKVYLILKIISLTILARQFNHDHIVFYFRW